MASLELRNKIYRVVFVHGGKKHGFTLDTGDRRTAEALLGGVEKTLMLMNQGILRMPQGCGLTDFVRSGGQPTRPPESIPNDMTVGECRDRYLAAHGTGAMEVNSLATVRMHLGHFVRTLGERFPLRALGVNDLQQHIDQRRKKRYRGRLLSPVTLKKEMASFRAAWNWATDRGFVSRPFPQRGLVYPKGDEKPTFLTRVEIERHLHGSSGPAAAELWERLFLRKEELLELLEYVQQSAVHPWIYPLICSAALTGARRSELLRAEVADVDLACEVLVIREKKRSRQQRTTRRVSITPLLKHVLSNWLAVHPGSRFLFCQSGVVSRSKKRSPTTGHRSEQSRATSSQGRLTSVRERPNAAITPITKDEAHDHFKRTLAGSKWEVLRGFHVLRHSFISSLAAAGVDQRIIDDFVGHQTEEQRRRYRHLIPDIKLQAVSAVFG